MLKNVFHVFRYIPKLLFIRLTDNYTFDIEDNLRLGYYSTTFINNLWIFISEFHLFN